MSTPKSKARAGLIVLIAAVVGVTLFVLRTKMSARGESASALQWDRQIAVSGTAETQLRCWLNYDGASEFRDLSAPTIIEVPANARTVEIRHTGSQGALELTIKNSNGTTGTAILSAPDEFADLFISKSELVWSKKTMTVARLHL